MDNSYISSPRALWEEPDIKDTWRSITLGGNAAGVKIYMNKKGVYINGYYAGLTEPKKYANMREFVFFSWEDFDKLRAETMRGKPKSKKVAEREPDKIDKPSDEYLESLILVTLNGKKFYIDIERQERRPVDNPDRIFNFEKQAASEAK